MPGPVPGSDETWSQGVPSQMGDRQDNRQTGSILNAECHDRDQGNPQPLTVVEREGLADDVALLLGAKDKPARWTKVRPTL